MLFCERLDLRLIKLVRAHPVLYDYNNVRYMDFNAREVAWQRIGDELERPAGDCKVRWINIRDVYRRILRRSLNDPEARKKMYKYAKEMSFMKPFYRDVTLPNSGCESDGKSNDAENEQSYRALGSEGEEDKPTHKSKTKRSDKSSKKKKKKKHYDEDKGESSNQTSDEEAATFEFDVADPVDAFLLSVGATLKSFTPYHLNLAKTKIFAVVQDHELQQIVQKQRAGGGPRDASAGDKFNEY